MKILTSENLRRRGFYGMEPKNIKRLIFFFFSDLRFKKNKDIDF